jgi:integral membrane protein
MNITKIFRYVALAEGISLIILLSVAMPLKYIWDQPDAVKIFGMAHGLFFVAFVVLAFNVMSQDNLDFKWLAKALLLSLIPFGTFYLDRSMKKEK